MILRALLLFTMVASVSARAQSYGLRNLRPVGLAQHAVGNDRKQLLHFQNELGDHYLLYEENSDYAGVREVASLLTFLGNPGHQCSIDLECKQKAFCTGDCKSLYYEMFNFAPPAGRNTCTIKAFTCGLSAGSSR